MKSRPKAAGTTYGPYAHPDGGTDRVILKYTHDGVPYKIPDGVPYKVPEGARAVPGGASSASVITTLWVGSLQGSVTEDDVFDSFQKYGFVTDVKLTPVSSATQYEAFVKFMLRDEANRALGASLNRQLLVKGKNVTCRWAQQDLVNVDMVQMPTTSTPNILSPSSSATEAGAATIWVGNLPEACTEAELRSAAGMLGSNIADVVLFPGSSSGSPHGSGLARFGNGVEAEAFLRVVASRMVKIRGTVLIARVHEKNVNAGRRVE